MCQIISCWRKTVHCGHKTMNNSKQKEIRQLMSHQVFYTLLHLIIFSMELCRMQFLEAIFHCREMNIHIALWCSATNETIGLLFLFQVANFNSSVLLLKTQERVLVNLMSFPSQNFISTVSDKCSLYSLSLSGVNRSSPCHSAIRTAIDSFSSVEN